MNYLFFISGYSQIYPTLSIIEDLKDAKEIIIATYSKQIKSFFDSYCKGEFKILYIDMKTGIISKKDIHKTLLKVLHNKEIYKKHFKDLKKWNVYFFGKRFNVPLLSFVKKMSKKNSIFFYDKESGDKYPTERSIRSFALRTLAKLFYNVETRVITRGNEPVYEVNDKFFKKITVISTPVEKTSILKRYTNKFDFIKNRGILIAMDDLVSNNFVEEKEFTDKINQLMYLLEENYHDMYVIKPHPRQDKLFGKMSNCKNIAPSFIPFEFLLAHPWKIVISIISTSLISAVQETNAIVISLAEIIKFKNENTKKAFCEWLKRESKNRIKFPSKLSDLKLLLEKQYQPKKR